jgi:hypothetical protein
VGTRTGLDELEKRKLLNLPGLELRLLGRSAHSQSLYRLRYPGSSLHAAVLNYLRIGTILLFYVTNKRHICMAKSL